MNTYRRSLTIDDWANALNLSPLPRRGNNEKGPGVAAKINLTSVQ
jgi:hypothetical protein